MAAPTSDNRTHPQDSVPTPSRLAPDLDNYSKAHRPHIALMDDYFRKIRAQEELYVKAGFPAEGLTDFLDKWFEAWTQDVVALRECFTDDMVYADPTTSGRDWKAGRLECDLYNLAFRFMPDMAFYPQDDTSRALPYYDFLDDDVRITVPWRLIGRGRFTLRPIDVVGVDRYNMVRDPQRGWLISRIDTDGDILGLIGQLLPIPIRAPRQRTVQILFGLAQKLFRGLRGPNIRPFAHELTA